MHGWGVAAFFTGGQTDNSPGGHQGGLRADKRDQGADMHANEHMKTCFDLNACTVKLTVAW